MIRFNKNDTAEDKKFREEAAKRLDAYKKASTPAEPPPVYGPEPMPENVKQYWQIDEELRKNPGISTTLAGTASMLKALPFGETLYRKIADTPEKQMLGEVAVKQNPKLSFLFGLGGGVGSTLGASSLLAPLKVAKGTGIGASVANNAAQAALIQPVISATNYNTDRSVGENLAKIGVETAATAATAGLLGGALKAGGNFYGNTVGFNRAAQRTGQAIDEYQFPQLREPQIYPMPPPKGQVVSPDIPVQYRQPVPKGAIPEMPLALPPAQGTYLKQMAGTDKTFRMKPTDITDGNPMESIQSRIQNIENARNPYYVDPKFRTEVAGDPTRPIKLPPNVRGLKSDVAQSNLRPLNNEGNMNLPSRNKNAPESIVPPNRPIQSNDGLLDVNLANFSATPPPASTQVLAPTVNRIVDSTDKVGMKQKISDGWKNFYNNWVDSQSGIKAFSKESGNDAYVQATNARKVGGVTNYIFNDALVDLKGNKIGDSLKSIAIRIPKEKESDFLDYMLHRHNMDRFAEGKPIYPDYNREASFKIVRKYEEAFPEFEALAKDLDRFLDRFRNIWLGDSGLVPRDVILDWAMKYPNYVPTFRKFTELEKANAMTGAKSGYVDQVAPVRAVTGSSRDVINPIASIMHMVNKTVRVATRNRVGQEIVKAVRANPEELKKIAEILPATKAEADEIKRLLNNDTVEGGIDELEKAFVSPYFMKGDNIVTVLENGKPVFLKINDKRFLDSIKQMGESNFGNLPLESVIRPLTNAFKTVVTQKNPIFAIKNVMRDIPTSYAYGSEKNPLKFLKQYGSAVKDIVKNKESYQQYKAVGGQMSGFFSPKDLTISKDVLMKDKNIFQKIGDVLETANQATESAPRLAEFKRILEKTGDVQKALYAAGEVTTNFTRGGKQAKAVDAYVPYFNASVQGLDRLLRMMIENPKTFVAKGVASVTLPTLIMEVWNRNVDPQGYNELDRRTKDINFVFPMGNGEFIKIPKSRETGVLFGSLVQRLINLAEGEPQAFKGFQSTVLTNFAPANPIENNLLSPLTLNLATNKDFAKRPIVPAYMKDLSPMYQYDEKTSEIAKWLGNEASKIPGLRGGLSPKQIDYIIRSYTGIIGQVGLPLATQNATSRNPVKSAFTSDVAYSNKAVNDFYDNINKLKTVAADTNFTGNIPSKIVTDEETRRNAFNNASDYMKFLRDKAKGVSDEEKRNIQLQILDIAKKMNQTLILPPNVSKDLLKTLKPAGYDAKDGTNSSGARRTRNSNNGRR